MFNEESFKLKMYRSNNLWTGNFVYKNLFKEENCFPFINELRKRALQANGATGTGAKKHKLIMNRFKLEINWSFLTIKWARSNFKMELEVFAKELDYMIIALNSRLALLAEKPSSQQEWIPHPWHHISGISSPHHYWRMIQKVSPCCWKLHWL